LLAGSTLLLDVRYAAKFFSRQVLPQISAQRAMAEATDNALMDVPEDAF